MCRGHDYERLEAFQQRMLNEFPHAIAMQHANQPDETIFQAEAQCIHTWAGAGIAFRAPGRGLQSLLRQGCSASGPSAVFLLPVFLTHLDFSLAPSEQNCSRYYHNVS